MLRYWRLKVGMKCWWGRRWGEMGVDKNLFGALENPRRLPGGFFGFGAAGDGD